MTNNSDNQIIQMNLNLKLEEFDRLGDPRLALDLMQIFLENTPQKVQNLMTLAETSQIKELKLIAHSLKSIYSNFGNTIIIQILNDMEHLDSQSFNTKIHDLSKSFLDYHNQFMVVIKEELQKRSAELKT